MFDKKAVDEYQHITAPDSLKQRVMDAASSRRKPAPLYLFPLVGSLVASLAVVFLAATMWAGTPALDVAVSAGDILLTAEEPMTADATPRTIAERYTLITLEADGEILIETDDTFLIEDESLTPLTSPYRTSGKVILRWNITEPEATLTVNGLSYQLLADIETATVSIQPLVQD